MDWPEILQELDEETRSQLLALVDEREVTWEDCMVCPDFAKCVMGEEDAKCKAQ